MTDYLPPNARDSDPVTSQISGQLITENGRRASLMEQAYETVCRYPGRTAGEIGELSGLGHQRVWRRLSDLQSQGKIQKGFPRIWQGRPQHTWYPVH